MILSDREIKLALARKHIQITPLPAADTISSTSVDLTLDRELSYWTPEKGNPPGASPLIVRPHQAGFDVLQLLQDHGERVIIPPEGFVLQPRAFVLGWTAERIRLPPSSRLAARVEGKSSLARLGLGVHVTAPTIHAGFGYTGRRNHAGTRIRLEIWNFGPLHILL